MIQRDLEAARKAWIEEPKNEAEQKAREASSFLSYVDNAGRFADFHALRHSYISLITQGGAHPKLAQRLARHSDINLTMGRYSHTVLADEAQALDSLPSFPSVVSCEQIEAERIVATGTDGRQNVLPSCLPKRGSFSCISGHRDASHHKSRECAKSVISSLETRKKSDYDAPGEVTERPIVLVSKTSVPATVPGVRIPPSPLLEEAVIAIRWLLLFWEDRFFVPPRFVLLLYCFRFRLI